VADDQNQSGNQSGNQTAEVKGNDQGNSEPEEVAQSNGGRTAIVLGVVLLLVLGAAYFYWRSTFIEDTDDAQVDGNLYQISARVSGQVTKVYVDDNQTVQAGQLLAEIDPTDYQVALDQAQANLASAQAEFAQATVNVPLTQVSVGTSVATTSSDVKGSTDMVAQSEKQVEAAKARVAQAKANALKAQDDVDRYKPLVQKDVISKQQYDAAVAAAAGSRAAVAEAEANVSSARQRRAQSEAQSAQSVKNGPGQIRVQQSRVAAAQAAIQQAQAKVEQARLNLSYTRITAPTAGIVNKKNVQVGANLAAGQDLMTVIPLTDLWVTANFKETQLLHMRPGQTVTIKVDAYGDRKFSGKVTQVGGATGSMLSLFPPENATGNYVKVVQRIPVRIDFTNLKQEDADYVLRPGLSVTPEVEVK
jgi:membrane fusion protein (multidrug efflux system)